jgi:hypothetical protein
MKQDGSLKNIFILSLKDSVTYDIVEDTTASNIAGSNSLDFFFVNQVTGEIYLRQALTNAPLNQYSVITYILIVIKFFVCVKTSHIPVSQVKPYGHRL